MPVRSGVGAARSTTRTRRAPTVAASPGSVPSYASMPWSTTSTRSQSRSMSPMSWVVSSSVVPRLARSWRRNSRSRCLLRHVQADGRLVQDQQLGGVQQRGRDLGAHPLAEGQLADRGVQARRHLQLVDQLGRAGRGGAGVQPVDRGEDGERLAQRQVPPQLAALAEDHPDPAGEVAAPAHRLEAAGAHRARGGHEDAGEHLDRGGLPGAVGPDVADRLARLHPEAHPVDGGEGRAGAPPPGALAAQGELPGQVLHVDDRLVRGHGQPPPLW